VQLIAAANLVIPLIQRNKPMLVLATQTFVNGTWNITPEEPATLQLALIGVGTLAVYAVLTGWRPLRAAVGSGAEPQSDLAIDDSSDQLSRQAA
jgi:hypothetical protein